MLDAIATRPGISRAGIAARTGLAKATVSGSIDRLVAANLIVDTGPQTRSGRGRRGTGLTLSPSGPHGLGVEIGVDYLATCLVDLAGTTRAHRIRACNNRTRSMRQVMAHVARAVRAALDEAEAMGAPVGGIGIAVPGLVESSGMLRTAPNLGWRDVDVRAELATRVDLADRPIIVGNEANFAATAELLSAESGDLRDFVHITGEIGVGAGIIINGALLAGVHGFSGEIGHVCVDPDGLLCGCGARGCLETMAGQDAIMSNAGVPANGRPPAHLIDTLTERLAHGDPAALDAARTAGRALGIALAALINIIDVPVVVLGGSYGALEPWIGPPILDELATHVISAPWEPPQVLRSQLGAEAAVRGAAAAAVQDILADPENAMASARSAT
ncbi:ROK family transcriptional regulator [Kribbella caucasensis]|uniref:ROK family transcriptional regulator n=1 Tax=Kribbella caucasensis TaxID=2512215 RepID=UPI00192E0398|nr:ROK family transcriptional regulator [Kribbella sp. VKM Ac-2527]